jgi:hypothetical protein
MSEVFFLETFLVSVFGLTVFTGVDLTAETKKVSKKKTSDILSD